MVGILTWNLDECIMWVLYFFGSMILSSVFFEKNRFDLKRVVVHLSLVTIGVILYIMFSHCKRVLAVIICIILVDMFYKGKYKCKLWAICITQCVYFIIFSFIWVLCDYIGKQLDIRVLQVMSISGIVTIAICIAIIKIFKGSFLYYKNKNLYESITWGRGGFYIIVSIAVTLTANLSVRIYWEGMAFRGGDVRIALVGYTALFGVIICYLNSRKIATQECEEEEAALINSFSEKQIEAYKRLERLEREGKFVETELEEKITKLMGVAEEEDLVYVKPYVDEIQRQLRHESNYILTGNTIVDSIINEKYKLACDKHVFISVNISLPEEIAVEVGDLCLIIGNSIDYALEACEHISLGKGSKIKIQGMLYKGYILFRIWFSKARSLENEEHLSVEEETRSATQNDIYGLGAVAKCLEKYDGTLQFYTEGKWHKLEFCFNTVK